MKTRFHVFFLLCLFFTLAVTASARQLILLTDSESGKKYVKMPVTGTDTLILDEAVSFQVYDDGGKDEEYSNDADAYLVLIAPTGKKFELSGSLTSESGYDYLTIYEGDLETGNRLLDSADGFVEFGPLSSTGDEIKLYFHSDGGSTNSGIDIVVDFPDPSVPHSLEVLAADGGSLVSNKSSALRGDTVLLTATPDSRYVLWNVNATNAWGKSVKVNGGKWYSGNTATLTMPYSDVSVTPEFALINDVAYDLSLNMPKEGTFTAFIPAEVDSFWVYDDGGEYDYYSEDANGNIVLKAPENHALLLTGYAWLNPNCAGFTVYDGAALVGKVLFESNTSYSYDIEALASSSNSMTIHFHSGECWTDGGLNFRILNLNLKKKFAVQVNEAENGTVSTNKATAAFSESVTLTATPETGYLLWNMEVTSASEFPVKMDGGKWYSNNSATVSMPYADIEVSPEFVSKTTAEDGLFINMPKEGTLQATIPNGVTSFKVFGDEGEDNYTSRDANGNLVLKAPENHVLLVTGSAYLSSECGELLFYEGEGTGGKILESQEEGSGIGAVASSANVMTVHFDAGSCYDYTELNLLVRSINLALPHTILAIEVEGGTISTNKASAKHGEVVTLTARPESGYIFSGLSAVDSYGSKVKFSFDGNIATFEMPLSDVTIQPIFSDKLSAGDGLFINMPTLGTKTVTIPDAVTSFRVYDDGGENNNYSNSSAGYLTITVPENRILRMSGDFIAEAMKDSLFIYDGERTGKLLWKNYVEENARIREIATSGNTVTFYFRSNERKTHSGLSLYVEIVDATELREISVSDDENGTISSDKTEARYGETVTLTATPQAGYFVWYTNVTNWSTDEYLDVSMNGNKATFKMPYSDVYAWPTFTNKRSIQEGLYVDMPNFGMRTISIPDGVTSFKVYDDGGKDSDYGYNADGYLALTAPQGYVLLVKGTIDAYGPYDALTILDGAGRDGEALLYRASGNGTEIDPVASTGRSMTLYFHSDVSSVTSGLDLDVEVIEATTEHTITVATVEGGTMVASAKKSVAGKTITLTASPADNYLLDRVTVVDADGDSVWMSGGRWYLGNVATMVMPSKNVSVTPVFTDKLTSEGDLHIDMPRKGMVKATIPANVSSFKVYDDGGKDGPYSIGAEGTLELTAPEGKVFALTGTVTKDHYCYLGVFDGDTNKTVLIYDSERNQAVSVGPVVSTGNVLTVQFQVDSEVALDGLDLTVSVIDPPVEHSITVASAEGGVLECYEEKALMGEKIHLYAYPQEGYVLDSIKVEGSSGGLVEAENDYWYSDNNSTRFTMPDENVVLTPVFSKKTSAEDGLYINLPLEGDLEAVIPYSVTSFMVYDDGGKSGNYGDRAYGSLVLIAYGRLFEISGSMDTQASHDSVKICDAEYDYNCIFEGSGKQTDIGTYFGTNYYMKVAFRSDESENRSGFAFRVNVHDASVMHAITVVNTTGGSVDCDVDSSLQNTDIALSIVPEDGYILDSLAVVSGLGDTLQLRGGHWYSGDTAWFRMPYADVTVTPSFKKKHTAEDGLFIDMVENMWTEVIIPKCVTSFKVYDHGGKDGDYGNLSYSTFDALKLIAAEGYVMQVTGSMNTAQNSDYLYIYDGGDNVEENLLLQTSGESTDIGSYSTTNRTMLITIESQYSVKPGFELTVNVEEAKKHSITIAGVTGGSVESDKAEAIIGDTIHLTASPLEGYLLNRISVVDAQGKRINVTGGSWITDMTASFVMPAEDVVVTCDYTNKWTAAGGLFAEMPLKGDVSFEIPEGVTSFKLYDDGGMDWDYSRSADGTLELIAPEGYVFKVSGSWSLGYYSSFYIEDDGYTIMYGNSYDEEDEETQTTLSNKLKLHFYAGSSVGEGLDFTVSVLPQNVIIARSYDGKVDCDNVSATEGAEVSLTAEPDGDYILHHISVTGLDGETIEMNGGNWYSNNFATFAMPSQKVNVVPSFAYIYDDEVVYEIVMPKTGTINATIPDGIKSFKVYDDGGRDGDYSNGAAGFLVMSAPEGYVFEVTGSVVTERDGDVFVAYDGDRDGKELFRASGEQSDVGFHISSGNVMTFSFASNTSESLEGLNLNVAVVKASTITKYAAVTVVQTIDSTIAIIDGAYLGDDTIAIPDDIDVDAVVYNRSFSTSGYSTITLPFDIDGYNVGGWSAVLEFVGIGLDEKGNKMVRMKYAWCDTCYSLDGSLKAYTPYIVRLTGENLSFYGSTTLKATEEPIVRQGDWEFRGTLSKTQWNVGDPELGYIWGFSADKTQSINIGDFVRAVDGTMVRPLRGYLVEKASNKSRRYAIDMYRDLGAKPVEDTPYERMKVVLVEDGDDGVERTTVIGHINTRTGEFKTEHTYDLKGRKVNGRPTARGAYYGKRR